MKFDERKNILSDIEKKKKTDSDKTNSDVIITEKKEGDSGFLSIDNKDRFFVIKIDKNKLGGVSRSQLYKAAKMAVSPFFLQMKNDKNPTRMPYSFITVTASE